MKSSYKTCVYIFLTGAVLLQSCSGKSLVKRSPQLSLTVVDGPEDDAPEREHPPSPEDLEERRVKLVKALIPGGGGGGGGALGSQLSSLSNLGVDLLSGGRISEIFAPLTNATKKATAGFPRVGDVINRVIDGAREYRKTARGAFRESASAKVNNGVKVFSTFTARGTEVLQGVFKLLRTLLDNFTFAVGNLARRLSSGLVGFTKTSSQFISRNVARARNLLHNQRLFQPAKDAAALGGNLVRGLAEDFTSLQPAVSDVIKTKLNVGTRFIPRVRLTSILSPLGDAEPCNDDNGGETVDVGDGGYGKKRGSDESVEQDESGSGEAKSSSMSLEDIPKDVLELLESSKSEAKANPEDDGTTTTAASKTTVPDSNEISETKQVPKSTTLKTTTTIATPSKSAAKSSKTIIKETTTATVKAKTSSSPSKKAPSSGGRTAVVEDLFGLNS